MPNEFLRDRHPLYDKWLRRWLINERRLRGGDGAFNELTPFDWEVAESRVSWLRRRERAPYLNFPEMYLTTMTGHLLREGPVPDDDLNFGTLGPVRRKENVEEPSLAETHLLQRGQRRAGRVPVGCVLDGGMAPGRGDRVPVDLCGGAPEGPDSARTS